MKTAFRFLAPDIDGNVIDIRLVADDLDEAFSMFAGCRWLLAPCVPGRQDEDAASKEIGGIRRKGWPA